MRGPFRALTLALLASATACGGVQYDPKTATFYEGKKGGMVMTPNGPVFHESADVPERVVSRDPNDPWRAPIGFILPKSGKFTQTSTPTTIATQGLVVVLRSSDTLMPSWGGEILVRLDVHATAAPGTTRAGESVAIVVDGDSDEVGTIVETALAQLGSRDRVTVIDAHGPRVLVPTMPATHRSLALAATANRLAAAPAPRNLSKAMALAKTALGAVGTRRTLVLTTDVAAKGLVAAHNAAGIATIALDPKSPTCVSDVQTFVPPAGPITFRDLTLFFDGTPAPSRILESSGGENIWTLEGSELRLGDLRAGEARSEILRVSVPAWVPGTNFKLHIQGRVVDAGTSVTRWLPATLHGTFDNDLERIAESRHGDVIAYASALATLHRLHAAFVGDGVEASGGLLSLAKMQASSLASLAHDFPDRGFAEDAAVLQALLAAVAP